MLENLLNLVKNNASNAIINNPDIPNERNEEAVKEASNSIMSTLQGALAGGGIKDVLGMFTNGENAAGSGIGQNMQSNFIQSLMGKFGLNTSQAGNIASSLLPGVLSQFVNKTNDSSDNSFNLQEVFNTASDGKTGGVDIQALMAKFKNGAFDADGDGDTDLQDAMAMLKGGGITNVIKNFFK